MAQAETLAEVRAEAIDLAGDARMERERSEGCPPQCTLAAARNLLRRGDEFKAADLAIYCSQDGGGTGTDVGAVRWRQFFQEELLREEEVVLTFPTEWLEPPELLRDVRLAVWGFENVGGVGHVVALRRAHNEGSSFFVYDNERRRNNGEAHLVPVREMGLRLRETRRGGGLTVIATVGSALESMVTLRSAARREEELQREPIWL